MRRARTWTRNCRRPDARSSCTRCSARSRKWKMYLVALSSVSMRHHRQTEHLCGFIYLLFAVDARAYNELGCASTDCICYAMSDDLNGRESKSYAKEISHSAEFFFQFAAKPTEKRQNRCADYSPLLATSRDGKYINKLITIFRYVLALKLFHR